MRRVGCRLAVVGQQRKPNPRPDLLEPDLVLPGQYGSVRDMPARGERALMLAVLEMAIRDLQLWGPVLRFVPLSGPVDVVTVARKRNWRVIRQHSDLIRWFRSDQMDHPFAFVSICETFGLDPGAVRKRLEHQGWRPALYPSHVHATAQQPRQLHGGYKAAP